MIKPSSSARPAASRRAVAAAGPAGSDAMAAAAVARLTFISTFFARTEIERPGLSRWRVPLLPEIASRLYRTLND
jgi:hypothetical protein